MDPIWYINNNISLNTTNNNTRSQLPSLEALDFWPYQVILIILYSTTAFISFGFNIITIIVLLKGDRMSSELWKFLINLSISDITMATFSIPFTYTGFMLGRWIFPPELCPFVQFAQLCSVFVSVWTLTAIGFDRYFAIVYPFRSLLWIKTHKISAIIIIWLSGIIVGLSQLIQSKAVSFTYSGNSYYDCREEWSETEGKIYTIFIFCITFVIPIVALIFVYSKIAFHIMRNVLPGNPDRNRDEVRVNRKIKVIKMLSTVVILFALCWLPIHLFSLLVWFHPKILNLKTKIEYYTYVGSYFFCHWISQFHSLINPIVYCFMSENFRNNLRSLLRTCFMRLKSCEKWEERDVIITQEHSLSSLNNPKNLRIINPKKAMNEDFV